MYSRDRSQIDSLRPEDKDKEMEPTGATRVDESHDQHLGETDENTRKAQRDDSTDASSGRKSGNRPAFDRDR